MIPGGVMAPSDREKIIVRTSIIGIAANIMLVAFKAVVGLAANSIAIVLDAVNNLTDALSSAITIIGAKLAGKKPDKDDPDVGKGQVPGICRYMHAAQDKGSQDNAQDT